MGLFVTNGFPSLDATVPILHALDRGGADFLEIGMPFSDPLAEGLPIQRSSAHALAHGVRIVDAFHSARAFRKHSETPLVLMGYINPILQYGVSNFCEAARSSGADALIIPDLPLEEAELVEEPARAHALDTIFLMAPNTSDERVRAIDQRTSGFVYAVSVTGLTGSRLHHQMDVVGEYLARARRLVSRNPLLVGFGIHNAAAARQLCRHTDGFIAGSALVDIIESAWCDRRLRLGDRLALVEQFARRLASGRES